MKPTLFTVGEVASTLGVDRATLIKEVRDQKLGCCWIRKRRRFSLADLREYLGESRANELFSGEGATDGN